MYTDIKVPLYLLTFFFGLNEHQVTLGSFILQSHCLHLKRIKGKWLEFLNVLYKLPRFGYQTAYWCADIYAEKRNRH